MEDLTPRQRQVLVFIQDSLAEHGLPPTRAEIAEALGFKSANAAEEHLRALQRKGVIELRPGASRGIQLKDSLRDQIGLPLIGRVAAGRPILAEENREGYLPVPPEVAPGSNCFVLQVQGDSMTGAGIYDGDYVIIRQQHTAENGEIVAALLGDEATIKRFFLEKDGIRLQPENASYDPILTREAEILGKVVGLYRRL